MAEFQQHAWQQLPRETDKAYQAFAVFRDLVPEERSLPRVASECTKSVSLIRRWSASWSWQERARAWDGYQELRHLERRIEEKQKMDDEHLKIVRGARNKAIQALAQTKVEDLANNPRELRNWITELIKLERLIMGEPETIEVRSEKIRAQATIEEHLKQYAPVFQELLDEGAIRLNGHHDQRPHENDEEEFFTIDAPDDE